MKRFKVYASNQSLRPLSNEEVNVLYEFADNVLYQEYDNCGQDGYTFEETRDTVLNHTITTISRRGNQLDNITPNLIAHAKAGSNEFKSIVLQSIDENYDQYNWNENY